MSASHFGVLPYMVIGPMIKKIAHIILLPFLLGISSGQEAATIPGLDTARTKFKAQLKEIYAKYDNQLLDLRIRYIEDLDRARKTLQEQGELTKLQEVQSEKSRFIQYRSWTGKYARMDRISPVVHPLLKRYQGFLQKLDVEYQASRKSLNDFYAGHLDKLKKSLTQQNKIDEALRIKSEIEGIENITPEKSSHPLLPAGKTAMDVSTPKALEKYLNQTRWALKWVGSSYPKKPEFMAFHFGGILSRTGTEYPLYKYKYSINKNLEVTYRDDWHLAFDPSFTTFYFHDRKKGITRKGFLLEKKPSTSLAEARDDLLLYYKFDEVDQVVKDSGPYGNHGSNNFTSVAHWGKRNAAFSFDGRRSEVTLKDKIDPDDHEQLSISLWFNTHTERGTGYLVRWANEGEGRSVSISLYRAQIYANTGSSPKANFETEDLKIKTWHHIVFTHQRNGSECLYLDGKLLQSHGSGRIEAHKSTLKIGSATKNGPYPGLLDELMIFKRVLSPDDVLKLYLATK